MKHIVADLEALQSSKLQTWKTIEAFITKYGYAHTKEEYESMEYHIYRIDVKYKSSFASIKTIVSYLFTGDIIKVEMTTQTTDVNIVDPEGSIMSAFDILFERTPDAIQCISRIREISKKPSHGVTTGSDALNMAIQLCRHFNCKIVQLNDGSNIHCTDISSSTVTLRKARILSRGSGWYESYGFRSVIEYLHPAKYKSIKKLHKIPLNEMINCMTNLNTILREAIIEKITINEVFKYSLKKHGPEKVKPSLKDVIAMANQICVSLDIMKEHQDKYETLGHLIDFLIQNKCAVAGDLVNALFPESTEYCTIVNEPGLPLQKTWIFAWQLVNTSGDLTLQI